MSIQSYTTYYVVVVVALFLFDLFFVNPIRNQYRYRAAILNKHAQKCEFHIILPLGCCKKIVVANLGYCFRHTGTNKQNHKFCLPVYMSVLSTCSLYINDTSMSILYSFYIWLADTKLFDYFQ